MQIPHGAAKHLLSNRLKDDAENWYASLPTSTMTIQQVIAAFKEEWEGIEHLRKIRKTINTKKQQMNERVAPFSREFFNLCSQLDQNSILPMDELLKVDLFTMALIPEIRKMVYMGKPETLAKAIEIAKRAEAAIGETLTETAALPHPPAPQVAAIETHTPTDEAEVAAIESQKRALNRRPQAPPPKPDQPLSEQPNFKSSSPNREGPSLPPRHQSNYNHRPNNHNNYSSPPADPRPYCAIHHMYGHSTDECRCNTFNNASTSTAPRPYLFNPNNNNSRGENQPPHNNQRYGNNKRNGYNNNNSNNYSSRPPVPRFQQHNEEYDINAVLLSLQEQMNRMSFAQQQLQAAMHPPQQQQPQQQQQQPMQPQGGNQGNIPPPQQQNPQPHLN
jgi:hypothetical protein